MGYRIIFLLKSHSSFTNRISSRYSEVDIEEVLYEAGEGPEFDLSSWRDVKFTLGLEFPNLPYLMDGDVKLTQTIPIMQLVISPVLYALLY